jgi:hypothetical protein
LLLATDNQGKTACHAAANRGKSEPLKIVWQFAKEILTTEELNKLLLGTDNQGMTVWHAVATSGKFKDVTKYMALC